MDKKIKVIIEKYKLLKEKAVVLAISGGPDSVVLLDLFVRFFPKDKIVVAHANHGIRLEARWDENFVQALADDYGVIFVSEKLQLNSTAEAAAREGRYDFLETVRQEFGANYVVTAHHLNDQVETILLSMVRGAGPLATWGMPELNGSILRPLLTIPKKDLLKYAQKRHLRYHIDRTNYDVRYARNRLRAKVIPQLTKLNPRFLETLDRNAELGREMAESFDVIISEKEKRISTTAGLEVKKLVKETPFIQKQLIKRRLEEELKRKEGVTQENVNAVYSLLGLARGKKTEIGGLAIIKGTKYLTFGKKKAVSRESAQTLIYGEEIVFNGLKLKMTKGNGKATKNNVLLDDSIGYNLKVRSWKEGDRIKTKSGTKKLSDVFTDAKISAQERRNWPVVTSGRTILWVPRLAASEVALNISKKNVIKIEVRNERKKK